MTLLARQRHLLQLVDALGGSVAMVDFQKLLFLYHQEAGGPYDFVPYKFGAFSFLSYADRRKLVERGLLTDDEQRWKLTPEGRRIVGGQEDMYLSAFARRHTLRGEALVAETYRRFPRFALQSEIAAHVLKGDRKALAGVQAARAAVPQEPALLTLGYEGRTIDAYLALLLESGVSVLCDVRRNPISRKYGFSKGTLSRDCASVGVQYEHLPELGIASEKRRDLETEADYVALFEEYKRDWLPGQGAAIDKIRDWVANGERVALTCFEREPNNCHRHCVSGAVEARLGKGFDTNHL